MNVLSIENLEKTVDDKALFSSVTLGLEEGEIAGMVGFNGAGKSTFLKVLAGLIPPDAGTVAVNRNAVITLLGQSVAFCPESTIEDYLYQADHPGIRILNDYAQALKSDNSKLANQLYARIESGSLYDIEIEYKNYLSKFGIKYRSEKKMDELSGGEQKKVALARVFALRPQIMLLDEPTNHLDIRTIEILENELRQSSSAAVIVTHDRYILNAVCQTVWELDRGHIYRHPGNYEAYLERRAERISMMQKEQDRLASILRRELIWLERSPQARTGKDKNRKERIEAMLSQVRNVQDARQTSFSSAERRLGKTIVNLNGISASYGSRKLFSDFSYSFKKGDKIGVVGDNGSGKSTLLDIIAGTRESDEGSVERGVNTYISYYDQLSRNLDSSMTALEYLEDIGSNILFAGTLITAERLLQLFGFSREKMRVSMSVLSGGEKRRIYLLSKLVENPNFLLLDEPTNDLDLRTMENLEEYVATFPGCVVIVSHDRAFLNCTCSSLFVIREGKIINVPSCYSQWKEDEAGKEKASQVRKTDTRTRREKKGLSFNERREMEALEREIDELEKCKARLEASFSDVNETEDGTIQERSEKYRRISIQIDEKTARYFDLAEKDI